jgi:hypothetical protein
VRLAVIRKDKSIMVKMHDEAIKAPTLPDNLWFGDLEHRQQLLLTSSLNRKKPETPILHAA